MFKKILVFGCFLGACVAFNSCGSSATEESTSTEVQEIVNEVNAEVNEAVKEAVAEGNSEAEIRTFINSIEGTYGWKTEANENMLDFFQDGRLHVQGPDGEATMWEGKWSLSGNKLTIECADINLNQTSEAKIAGENLMIGDVTYTRYKP